MDVLAVPPFAEFFCRAFPGSECLSSLRHNDTVTNNEAHEEHRNERPVRMQDLFQHNAYCSVIDSYYQLVFLMIYGLHLLLFYKLQHASYKL